MAEWYGSREQLMSLHGLDSAMLGYGMGAAAFTPLQPDAYSHAHAAAAAAYNFQRQQSVTQGFTHSCFAPDQQWRHGADGRESQTDSYRTRSSEEHRLHTTEIIMELRKEKSRDAARSRRGKENYEFYELAKMLPLPAAITSQLDKASIIRLTISYLKLRDFTMHGDPPWRRGDCSSSSKALKGSSALRHRSMANLSVDMFELHQGTHILQSLDGFAFILAADGRFLYISETVSIYLGLSQVELTGSSVFDYIHQEDHSEMADQLGLTLTTCQPLPSPSSLASEEGSGSSQGTMNPDVAACMTVVLVLGQLRPQYVFSHARKSPPILIGFGALAIALPPPSIHEVRLESDMFVTRINFDFRIAHCEPKVTDLLDYTPDELQGRSLYSLCHGQDILKLRKTHQDLKDKGQVMSPYFRFLNKNGGFTWMQTCATVVCNTKNGDEQNIICVNYVLSAMQYDNVVLDHTQMDPAIANMKNDDTEYVNPVTPVDHRSGDGSSEERGKTPKGIHGSAGASPTSPNEKIPPNLGGTSSASLVSTQIKTEVPGLLTPIGNTEMQDDTRVAPDNSSSSPGRVSVPPNSAPGTPHARATPGATPVPMPHSGMEESPRTSRSDEGSVRDLEAAMTRHLPDDTTDFSTDTLLKTGAPVNNGGQRSTIQWVGGASGQPSALPASTLLRQLYANRESVIRSSVQRAYYSDVQTALPTPPGSEGYQDSMFPKGQDFPFGANAIGLTSTAGPTMGSFSDYHSAMTPPSSVSPREKMNSDCNDLRAGSYLAETGGGIPAQPLPLKPQVYSYGASSVQLDSSSYSTPLGDQASLYTPSSFHLYHSSSGKSPSAYDSLRAGGSWYAPS